MPVVKCFGESPSWPSRKQLIARLSSAMSFLKIMNRFGTSNGGQFLSARPSIQFRAITCEGRTAAENAPPVFAVKIYCLGAGRHRSDQREYSGSEDRHPANQIIGESSNRIGRPQQSDWPMRTEHPSDLRCIRPICPIEIGGRCRGGVQAFCLLPPGRASSRNADRARNRAG